MAERRRDEAKVFTAILDGAVDNVGASDVVPSDVAAVTLDFSDVGLNDILDFRARHRSEFRAYVVALQALVAGPPTRHSTDRTTSLAAQADRLRELQERRWPMHQRRSSVTA